MNTFHLPPCCSPGLVEDRGREGADKERKGDPDAYRSKSVTSGKTMKHLVRRSLQFRRAEVMIGSPRKDVPAAVLS